eukprot:13321610-Alexandrium_andersonii.AAC.1
MSASLVGSEMCIRDRSGTVPVPDSEPAPPPVRGARGARSTWGARRTWNCLLYTSDAADDM